MRNTFTLINLSFTKMLRALFVLVMTTTAVMLFVISGRTSSSPLVISEFRLRGPNGAADEFIEIYNSTDVDHTVASSDGSSGYALAASDGTVVFIIRNGTVIPARGHILAANSVGYSIAGYPAGNGTTAAADVSFTTNIDDNAGIALFSTSNSANFDVATRLDAVGSTSEANDLYKEGAGYPALIPFSIDSSFYRKVPSLGESAGLPQDTDDNASDFLFVDTNGTSAGAGQRLGAPGPENLSGPRTLGTDIDNFLLDPAQTETDSPNVVRSFDSDPPNNSTFGTLSIRRTFTNNTGEDITRLRFRITEITTFRAPSGTSDLRPRTSDTVEVPLTRGDTATVQGTTLEEPPSQPNGGGFNTSMSVNSVTTETPLVNGASVNVQFLLGIQQTGCYVFAVVAETLPNGGSEVFLLAGSTEGGVGTCLPPPTPGGSSLIISEFRLRGSNGSDDEFVEIYNNSDTAISVATSDGSAGYALVASDGIARFVIPNGTLIPARGHFLGVNSGGYSLASYPAGNGTTATGNATFTTNISDNAGIALFKTANAGNFNHATRLDAVGSASEANTLYKEGTGYPPLTPFSIDYSFHRRIPSSGTGAGFPADTGNNAADLRFVDTNGTSAGAGQRLGAPGPENLSGPGHLKTGASIGIGLIDPAVAATAAPNYRRDFTSDPANNSTFGTVSVRRRFTNLTGTNISRMRLRFIDLTAFPSPPSTADLRPLTSSTIVVPVSGGGTATVRGTTLEQPPSQPNGGGVNSSMSAPINLATPLAAGNSIDLQLLFGVQHDGAFSFCAVIETLPFSSSALMCFAHDPIPVITSAVGLILLSPINSDLVNVDLTASANEPVTLNVQVFGNEDDETPTSTRPPTVHSPDAKDIGIGTLRLRAERTESGDGRVYLVVVSATDTAGNSSHACHTVVVPRKKKGNVDEQAAAAKAFCEANNGAPPRGYFVIGDGPIIGPKQ